MIPGGKTHIIALAHPTLRSGLTTVSGAADGLGAGSTIFRTVGFTGSISEYHLGLFAIPKLPGDGKVYEAVTVQLQDQAGLPVLAKTDVAVSLSSGSLIAGSIQEEVTISKGSSLVTAEFRTADAEDESFKITASSDGFTSVETEMDVTKQPMTIFKSSEFPTKVDFGEVPIAIDVYSGSIPVRNANVTITGTNAKDTFTLTDDFGHAEGVYVPTLPGSNTITVRVEKPGFERAETLGRVTLLQTIDVMISAETQGGSNAPVEFKVNLPSTIKPLIVKPGVPEMLQNANWGTYVLTAPLQVTTADAVYDFVEWSDGSKENPHSWSVVENSKLTAIYKARYLLEINDEYGMALGAGYYEEGKTVDVRMSSTTIPGILTDKEFAGWDGSIKSSEPTTEVFMDSPKKIEVQWKDNILKVSLIGVGAGVGVFSYYWRVVKPKRELQAKERAPDLDWYKT
jgi:hypothetical protein